MKSLLYKPYVNGKTQACPDEITLINLINSALIIRTVSKALLCFALFVSWDPFYSSEWCASRYVSNRQNLRDDCRQICVELRWLCSAFPNIFKVPSKNVLVADKKAPSSCLSSPSATRDQLHQRLHLILNASMQIRLRCYHDASISWMQSQPQISYRIFYTWNQGEFKSRHIKQRTEWDEEPDLKAVKTEWIP